MKNLFLVILSFACLTSTFAQQKITVKMPLDDSSKYVHLAHYYGYKQFIKVDSAKADSKGLLHFESDSSAWKGGIYLVVLSPSKFYDFIYSGDENDIYMEFDTANYVKSVKFKNSPENNALFSYRKFLDEQSDVAKELQEKLKTEKDPAAANLLKSKLSNIQKEVRAGMVKAAGTNKNLFASKVIMANLEPELTENVPILPNGRPDSTYNYRLYKKQFFDNIDFSDERMIRTPFLEGKLDRYFNKLVYQSVDSLKKESSIVLEKSKADPMIYRYVLWFITNNYENTQLVGLDGVIVHLYENYYLKDASWLDAEQKKKFQDRLNIIKPIETGKIMPPLVLKDSLGVVHDLYDVKAKYTIVYFYSPTCGHCKDHAPHLVKFYEDNKDKGFAVWNVSSDPNRSLKEMKDFIKTYDTGRLTNLYDPDRKYDFMKKYDVYSTPTLYILDKDKHIVAKRIPIEDLTKFIEFHESKQK